MNSVKIKKLPKRIKIYNIKTFVIKKKKTLIVALAFTAVLVIATFITLEIRKQLYVNELLTTYQSELTAANVTDKTFIVDGIDHTNLLFNLISDIYFENAEKDSVQDALNTNTQKLSLYFAKNYTEEQKIQFTNLWKEYIQTFVEYTNAKKSGDIFKIREQLSKITSYPAKIATFYNSLNPNFSLDLVNLIFSDYSSTIKTIIDTYDVKDYKGVYMHRKVAISQMEKINTLISSAIENSFK